MLRFKLITIVLHVGCSAFFAQASNEDAPGAPGLDTHWPYWERDDGGNYDGRKGIGRLRALLTGERGEYDVAAAKSIRPESSWAL